MHTSASTFLLIIRNVITHYKHFFLPLCIFSKLSRLNVWENGAIAPCEAEGHMMCMPHDTCMCMCHAVTAKKHRMSSMIREKKKEIYRILCRKWSDKWHKYTYIMVRVFVWTSDLLKQCAEVRTQQVSMRVAPHTNLPSPRDPRNRMAACHGQPPLKTHNRAWKHTSLYCMSVLVRIFVGTTYYPAPLPSP